jgi:hypothetical protein
VHKYLLILFLIYLLSLVCLSLFSFLFYSFISFPFFPKIVFLVSDIFPDPWILYFAATSISKSVGSHSGGYEEFCIYCDLMPGSPLKALSSVASWWFLASLILQPWRWRRYISPKRRLIFNWLRGLVSQKIEIFNQNLFIQRTAACTPICRAVARQLLLVLRLHMAICRKTRRQLCHFLIILTLVERGYW